ncbi:hypothetical protein [Argonema antarcticum]|uniref:hypothetical protein n=1 Tax=Argonema antarcticum TaxID=2942763 RepID=UPI002013B58D|nr:hypothetical protein [Argonema antarcticum]MCL1470066.1 hypothetical protein [Argonema antarcticum A004/B2]
MPSRRYSLLGLAITLVVTFTGQSGVAFTINYPPPDGRSNAFIRYNERDYEGEAYLVVAEEIERGGTNELWQLLNDFSSRYPGRWEFQRAENDLQGSFNLLNYYICGPQTTDCGAEIDDPVSGGVGAMLDLRYYPVLLTGDPVPDPTGITRRVQWIQRVYSNHSLNPDRHGSIENVLDINIGQTTPYYSGVAGNGIDIPPIPHRFFTDVPYRVDPVESHFWDAELYLVEETQVLGSQKRIVTIYNGMKWGWRNVSRPKPTKTFSSTLTSGSQTDKFTLDKLTPGSYFYGWTNNSIPSNRCNPNTHLGAYSSSGYKYDDDSSPVGDGFASALAGIVPDSGIIDLFVGANGGRRGEDKGSYELNVKVYDSEPAPPSIIIGSSGGGGVSRPRPGNTQQNPILPNRSDGNWQVFSNVPGCRWYDPHTTHGFEFQALEDTLFTEILDFPVGLDNRFTVRVGDAILGEFGPGDSVDFVSLLGEAVSHFKITDIDALIGETESTAFPIQLAFNQSVGSFQMRAIQETPEPRRIPEPPAILGLFMLGAWGVFQGLKIKNGK